MSTEIIKSIAINEKAGTVFITSHSSNVSPAIPKRWQATFFENMLKEEGRDAVDSYLLEQYQGGMMRGGNNDYEHAIKLDISLEEVRKIKKDFRGKKFVIEVPQGWLRQVKRRGATCSPSVVNAKRFNKINAMLTAKRFEGAEIKEVTE